MQQFEEDQPNFDTKTDLVKFKAKKQLVKQFPPKYEKDSHKIKLRATLYDMSFIANKEFRLNLLSKKKSYIALF